MASIASPASDTRAGADGAIAAEPKVAPLLIDCDCHHLWGKIENAFPYLPRHYVEHIKDFGSMIPSGSYTNMPNRHAYRVDHEVEEDTDAAAFTVTEHLDRYQLDIALLTGGSTYPTVGIPNADYAAALCRAFNDYTVEHWLAKDARYRMTISIPVNDPPAAATEIARMAANPAAAAVMMPAGSHHPFGNRFYDPIHRAAAEHGLPIVTHFGGEGTATTNPPTAAGYPSYYLEMRMARPQIAQAHAVSMICEGVFERYPTLRWMFVEVDTWWIPGLLWHFDADWKAVREYTPWVKRLPSEYFREFIRVGTQPMEQPPRKSDLATLLEWMHAEEVLVYASDFPHWDWDEPRITAAQFPKSMRNRIFGENAREVLRLGG